MKRREFGGAATAFCYALWALPAHAAGSSGLSAEETAWATQWRELRAQRGHFDGAPWNNTVDHWQGSKHRLMQSLAGSLVNRRATAADTLVALGPPDTLLRPPDTAHARVAARLRPGDPAAAAQAAQLQVDFWVYRWRGTHDQLVLTVQLGHAVAAGWLHDLE